MNGGAAYSTCLACCRPLGVTDQVCELPFGDQVAFDPRRQRIWVVCPSCREWNLVALEAPESAIAACERLFEDARVMAAADAVTVAALASGMLLVRVGPLTRHVEYAMWRYGGRLERRRRGYWTAAAVAAVAAAGLPAFGPGVGVSCAASVVTLLAWRRSQRHPVCWVRDAAGTCWPLRGSDVRYAELRPRGSEGWRLVVSCAGGLVALCGAEAMPVLARILRHTNRRGAGAPDILRAMAAWAEIPGLQRLLARAAALSENAYDRRMRLADPLAGTLGALPRALRFALEIAVTEDAEQRRANRALATLAAEWRAADDLAHTADEIVRRVPDAGAPPGPASLLSTRR